VLIDLAADRSLQRGERLAELGFALGNLKLELEHFPQRREGRREVDVAFAKIALGQFQGLAGPRQDLVAEQAEDVLLGLGLHEQVLDLARGFIALGLVELRIGQRTLLGLADPRAILVAVNRQVERDKEADIGLVTALVFSMSM
jgi:hypothetical protein